MAEIIRGKVSPRMENGVLYFHEGDTFVFTLHLELKNMGVPVPPEEISSVTLLIRDAMGDVVFYETAETNGLGSADFIFSHSVSAEFKRGRYNYDVAVKTGEMYNTVASRLSCVVV